MVTTNLGSNSAPHGSSARPYDVVVVGGGAAGLSGAIALLRARRSVQIIDSGMPRNAPAAHAHNFLTRDGVSPLELLRLGRDEVARYGGALREGRVATIRQSSDADIGFHVALEDGATMYARRILIATGATDELPPLPGIAERWGKDVLHCPYCHGWEVRDQAVGILGTGPMAVHSTLLFRQWSADVMLFQHTAPPLTPEQREQLTARDIPVVDGLVTSLEINADRLTGVRLESGEIIPRQALVLTTRLAAQAAMLADLGLRPVERELDGYVISSAIPADAIGATSVRGVWVAGNVADPFGHLMTSAAAGLKAGAAINADLIHEETMQAVAAARARNR